MSQVVLYGGPFEVYDTEFQEDQHLFHCVLGGVFEMPEDLARRTILHGAALLPKDRYDELGITAEEEKQYPNADRQAGAPDAFKAKLLAARIAGAEYRAELAQEK